MSQIRPIDRNSEREIELVAMRMRDTLVEVLGEERGGAMYTLEWLIDRAKLHLDPVNCTGEIFLAVDDSGEIVGHTIVRLEKDDTGQFGLFSTIYVVPSARGGGHAKSLIAQGEEWFNGHGMLRLYTYTEENNEPLKRLFCAMGFHVAEIKDEFAILMKTIGSVSDRS